MTNPPQTGYIGPNVVVHGRLSGTGELAIDGKLEGDVVLQGDLTIGGTGKVVAAVQATVLAVAGELRGNVNVTDEVIIHDGGLIDGDVRAPQVAIEDGGALSGGIEMDFELVQGGEGPLGWSP